MSLVVAIKQKNRIVLGADKQISTGDSKNHTSTKIWPVYDLNGAIMGSVGSARASQIIQYANIVDKNNLQVEPTTDFVVCSLVEPGENGLCDLMPNAFIFAYRDKAWMIWNDLSVSEIEDYFAIGSGSDVASGALYATKEKNPFERVVTAIDAAAETTLFVDDGIDVLVTEEHKDDEKLLAKALGIEIEKEKAKKTAK